jgi:hypothetical protein
MADENIRNVEPKIPLNMSRYEEDSHDGMTAIASEDDPTYDLYIPELPQDLSLPNIVARPGTVALMETPIHASTEKEDRSRSKPADE